MTITTIRPNGVASGGSNYTITGGSANIQTALNDDSNSTYIRKTNNGTASVIVNFGTTTVSASQIVKRVRLRAKVQTPTTDGKLNVYLGTLGYVRSRTTAGTPTYYRAALTPVNVFTPAVQIRGQQSTQEFTGPWYTATPDGVTWDQDAIDAARVQVTDYRDSTDRAYVYELYIDVDKATQPTVTVSTPTGTITTTSSPEISWSYSDTDGDAQTYYEVKIFNQATYSAGGFNASTATATWGSGTISSINTTSSTGAYLANGTYRAYVRVAKTINSKPFWSDWAYSGFVVNVAPPTTPTLATSYSVTQGMVTLTATGGAPTGYDSQTFQIERSDDGGISWQIIRNADAMTPNGSYVATVNDYEAPRGQVVNYRTRAVAVIASETIISPYSAAASVTITNDGKWWLKAVNSPSLNLSNVRVLAGIQEEQQEDLGVFRPIGRSRAVVVAGDLYGKDGTYVIVTLGDEEFGHVSDLANHQDTLLVQDPFGTQKYIRTISRKWGTTGAVTAARRQLELGYVEVAE